MFSGSITLRGITISSKSLTAPKMAVAPVSKFFEWAVPEGSLGTHNYGDKLYTTLSARYGGEKVRDYKITAGAIPASIALNPMSGAISGPLTVSGRFIFTIRASVDLLTSDATYNMIITP